MSKITVLYFEGTGNVMLTRQTKYDTEPALIRAGHVGIMGVIPDKIIGFSPTPEAAEKAGGELQLLQLLIDHIPQPGRLQDDTEIFQRAKLLASEGAPTTVYKFMLDVSESTVDTLKEWYNETKEAQYTFPNFNGSFAENTYNCATFPGLLGVPLPVVEGRIKRLIAKLDQLKENKELEIEEW